MVLRCWSWPKIRFSFSKDPKESKHHDFQAEAKEVVSTSMYAASGGVEVSAWDLNDWKGM